MIGYLASLLLPHELITESTLYTKALLPKYADRSALNPKADEGKKI
jgi:hypothetical protein